MARPLRCVPPHSMVEVTTLTIQGRLLLRPSPELTEIVLGIIGKARLWCQTILRGRRADEQAGIGVCPFVAATGMGDGRMGSGRGQFCDVEGIQDSLLAQNPLNLNFAVRARHGLARAGSQAHSILRTERD